jgi:hypothetical protein
MPHLLTDPPPRQRRANPGAGAKAHREQAADGQPTPRRTGWSTKSPESQSGHTPGMRRPPRTAYRRGKTCWRTKYCPAAISRRVHSRPTNLVTWTAVSGSSSVPADCRLRRQKQIRDIRVVLDGLPARHAPNGSAASRVSPRCPARTGRRQPASNNAPPTDNRRQRRPPGACRVNRDRSPAPREHNFGPADTLPETAERRFNQPGICCNKSELAPVSPSPTFLAISILVRMRV